MMDGVKIYCPLRPDEQFIKHGVIYEAPYGIFCRTLIRGPKNCFLSSIANEFFDSESNCLVKELSTYEIRNEGVMKIYYDKDSRKMVHKAVQKA